MKSIIASIFPPIRAIRVIRGCFLSAILVLAGAGCSTPPKVVRVDPEIERNVSVARSVYSSGSAEKAAIYYQKALRRARVMDASAEIARNAYNLAACLVALHSYDEAQARLDEARLEFQRAGILCLELPLLEAKIARARGRTQEAAAIARAELSKSHDPDNATRIQWRLLLAELLCDQGQTAAADTELALIDLKQLKASGNDIQAETALTRARVQMLQRNPQEAAPQYDTAARHWQAAWRYGDMVVALTQAGHAYEDAGNSSSAADRYYRAARSLFESDQLARARDLATQALPLAVAAHQPDLQRQVERLKAEIDRQQQKVSAADKKVK
ncbi:MAG: hypothetical protein PHW60_12085 [Kiritimatiellae bacterium]|nr:hypothetical protein [Kiritimatiellia bacterium]